MKQPPAASRGPSEAAPRTKAAAPKAKVGHSQPTQSTAADSSRAEAICAIAFALYEARGREGGHELDDWLRAEAQVDHALAATSATAPGAPQNA